MRQIQNQILNQIWDRTLDLMSNAVTYKVRPHLHYKICDQIWFKIANQVYEQITTNVLDQVE